jgi:hypoxanthine-guanine phosphoribosyltransferase
MKPGSRAWRLYNRRRGARSGLIDFKGFVIPDRFVIGYGLTTRAKKQRATGNHSLS